MFDFRGLCVSPQRCGFLLLTRLGSYLKPRKHSSLHLLPYVLLLGFGVERRLPCNYLTLIFLGRSIRVDREIPENDTFVTRPPKQGSNRVVPAPDGLLVMLSEDVRNVGTVGAERWLFPNGRGGPLLPKQADYRWKKAREGAGLPDAKLHNLRHFYASGLIASGCDAVTAQRAMGHSSASMTLNTYSHLWQAGCCGPD